MAAIVGATFVTLDGGIGGLIGGTVLVAAAVGVSFTGVSMMRVYDDGLELAVGPFGLLRRWVPRGDAQLEATRSLLVSRLRITSSSGPIVGPIATVSVWDRWPEPVLRDAGYRFSSSPPS